MCAHTDSKNGIFTRRVLSAYVFDSYPLPLLRRFIVGAAIEKNFFIFSELFDLISFARLLTCFLLVFNSHFNSIKIRHLILDFIQNICIFNSLQVFTRHSSSASFCVRHVWIARFLILNFDSFLLSSSYVDSMLYLFNSLSLLLVINKYLCLYEFVLCLF